MNQMKYYYPFGEELKRVVQQDRTPKKVFVLGVYASAVHAKWMKPGIPQGAGTLEPADPRFNGPSAKVLDEHILAPLGFTRKDAWLCDLLPETRLNKNQSEFIKNVYDKDYRDKHGLNKVTIPKRPYKFCDSERCKEIVAELEESKAELLVLLGDIPIKQFLNAVASVDYKTLQEYIDRHNGYGTMTEAVINGKCYKILPLAHPRQIGALGSHSSGWYEKHQKWENQL